MPEPTLPPPPDEEQGMACAQEPPPLALNNQVQEQVHEETDNVVVEAAIMEDENTIRQARDGDDPQQGAAVHFPDTIVYALALEEGDHDSNKECLPEPKAATVLQVLPGNDEGTANTAPYESNDSLPTVIDLTWGRRPRRPSRVTSLTKTQKCCLLLFPLLMIVVIGVVAYAGLQTDTAATNEDALPLHDATMNETASSEDLKDYYNVTMSPTAVVP